MSKLTHSRFWGTGKTILFWVGAFFALASYGGFSQGDIKAGFVTGLIGLVLMGAALNTKSKNRYEE